MGGWILIVWDFLDLIASNQFLGLWISMVHWKKWCPRDMAGYGNYLVVLHWYSLNVVCV
jgi:hypothetical protein